MSPQEIVDRLKNHGVDPNDVFNANGDLLENDKYHREPIATCLQSSVAGYRFLPLPSYLGMRPVRQKMTDPGVPLASRSWAA